MVRRGQRRPRRRAGPGFARRGAERFVAAGHGAGWSLQGWLTEFDHDSGRWWSWWDLTRSGDRTLSLWVDAGAESFFACDDLRWAAYTAGAASVAPHVPRDRADWLREPSL
ncbi:hypothetical protein [Kitasatospora sp. HPMI-4]|uniref:hypothetical protein n=1 Tax=Kitasatospora sp. HPMI-4 TaxID=3448443 RepID=UPI003F1C11CE